MAYPEFYLGETNLHGQNILGGFHTLVPIKILFGKMVIFFSERLMVFDSSLIEWWETLIIVNFINAIVLTNKFDRIEYDLVRLNEINAHPINTQLMA